MAFGWIGRGPAVEDDFAEFVRGITKAAELFAQEFFIEGELAREFDGLLGFDDDSAAGGVGEGDAQGLAGGGADVAVQTLTVGDDVAVVGLLELAVDGGIVGFPDL